MTDLTETTRLAWVRADARFPCLDPAAPPDPKARSVYAAEQVLSALAAPANRDALVAWLIEAGIVSDADVWDAPDVTAEQIEAAEDRIDQARRAFRAARAKAERADPEVDSSTSADVIARENRLMDAASKEWEEFEAAEHALEDLHETAKRVTVYYEDEDRPVDAVPLYRFNREGERG